VGRDIEVIVEEWIRFLQTERLWGPDEPLFPASKSERTQSGYFENVGLDRKHWKSAAAVRTIFKMAFERAGLPYFNPHSLRNTLALLGERVCNGPEEFKAWSQNLGHENVLTTFTSYGNVTQHRQDDILERMATRDSSAPPETEKRPMVAVDPDRLDRLEKLIADLQTARQ
jgi:integrase